MNEDHTHTHVHFGAEVGKKREDFEKIGKKEKIGKNREKGT